MIELTDEQRQALKNGHAIRLPAPEIGEDIVLLRATQYENMQESIEDQSAQRTVLRYALQQAAKVHASQMGASGSEVEALRLAQHRLGLGGIAAIRRVQDQPGGEPGRGRDLLARAQDDPARRLADGPIA